jgi:hypothetical protein
LCGQFRERLDQKREYEKKHPGAPLNKDVHPDWLVELYDIVEAHELYQRTITGQVTTPEDAHQLSEAPVENAEQASGDPNEDTQQSSGGPIEYAHQSSGDPVENAQQSSVAPIETAQQSSAAPVENAKQSSGDPIENAEQSSGAPVDADLAWLVRQFESDDTAKAFQEAMARAPRDDNARRLREALAHAGPGPWHIGPGQRPSMPAKRAHAFPAFRLDESVSQATGSAQQATLPVPQATPIACKQPEAQPEAKSEAQPVPQPVAQPAVVVNPPPSPAAVVNPPPNPAADQKIETTDFSWADYEAIGTLTNSTKVSASHYRPGPDGFAIAVWMRGDTVLKERELEEPNQHIVDGKLVRPTPHKEQKALKRKRMRAKTPPAGGGVDPPAAAKAKAAPRQQRRLLGFSPARIRDALGSSAEPPATERPAVEPQANAEAVSQADLDGLAAGDLDDLDGLDDLGLIEKTEPPAGEPAAAAPPAAEPQASQAEPQASQASPAEQSVEASAVEAVADQANSAVAGASEAAAGANGDEQASRKRGRGPGKAKAKAKAELKAKAKAEPRAKSNAKK